MSEFSIEKTCASASLSKQIETRNKNLPEIKINLKTNHYVQQNRTCICWNPDFNQLAFDLFYRQQQLALDSRFCRRKFISKLNYQLVFAPRDFKENWRKRHRFEL